jgi:arylformamidase
MSTPEFFNQEYNARAAIANAAEIFALWRSKSLQTKASRPGLQNLKYGSGPEESLDLFWCLKPDRPLFVFIHGGYWRALHKDDFAWIAEPYLDRGVNVAVLNYDLVPNITMEAQVLQVLNAICWLYDNSEALDFERNKIYLGGHSAGGHLAAMMLCANWRDLRSDLPASLVKGAVAVSGLFDLDPISKAPFLNDDLKLDPARVAKLSPAYLRPSHRSELILSVGELESSEFHRQSHLLSSAWQESANIQRVDGIARNHLTICDALAETSHPLFEASIAMMVAS